MNKIIDREALIQEERKEKFKNLMSILFVSGKIIEEIAEQEVENSRVLDNILRVLNYLHDELSELDEVLW